MKVILSSIYPYIFLLFCFLIPLTNFAVALPNIILIILVVIFPFILTKHHLKKLKNPSIIIYGVFIAWLFINSFLINDFSQDVSILVKFSSLLLLIILGLPLSDFKKIRKAILLSGLTVIGFSLVSIYLHYGKTGSFEFASGGFVNEVLVVERLYLGFICILCVIISLSFIKSTYDSANKWYVANIILHVFFILIISSRIAIVVLLAVYFLNFFYTKQLKTHLSLLVVITLLLVGAFSFNNNLKERIFFTHNVKQNVPYIELIAKWEPRVAIWNCNFITLQKSSNAFFGIGFRAVRVKLNQCYKDTIEDKGKREYFVKSNFNPHNQYLDILLSQGIVPFLLFVVFLLSLLIKNKRSYYKTSIVLSMMLFALIECVFYRQMGAYLFGLALVIVLFHDNKKLDNINSNKNLQY